MNNNFKRTFNAVKMSRKRQEEIRAGLSSLLYEKHKEGYLMSENTISSKKSRVLVIAIAAILSLSLVGFAFGHQSNKEKPAMIRILSLSMRDSFLIL